MYGKARNCPRETYFFISCDTNIVCLFKKQYLSMFIRHKIGFEILIHAALKHAILVEFWVRIQAVGYFGVHKWNTNKNFSWNPQPPCWYKLNIMLNFECPLTLYWRRMSACLKLTEA